MKQQVSQFFTWLRNGTCFCFTWLLLLLLICNHLLQKDTLSTAGLWKLFLLSLGGTFLFCLFFTRLFLKKWLFCARLTGFMICISIYECLGLYWLGLFRSTGTLGQWTVFAGIVLCLYFICIIIYQFYSRKTGALYTRALQEHQEKRRLHHEK